MSPDSFPALPILDPQRSSAQSASTEAATAAADGSGPLIDTFGRLHDNLRISVTDRCNLRCFYCMPADHVEFMPRSELLSFDEIAKVVRALIPCGVHKLRLTGGEPLVRRELHRLVKELTSLDGITDLGLTTNGLLLADQAVDLFKAGLRRLNVSLDALDPESFTEFTRRSGFEQVMSGIAAAQAAGFQQIKINAVSVRGLTERQVVPFGELARSSNLEIRFIEYMPLDAESTWERERVLFAEEIRQILSRDLMPLRPRSEQADRHAPATEFEFVDGRGRISFIASVSEPFCRSCNRIRLTADGKLRNCLFSLEETDLRGVVRDSALSEDAAAIRIRGLVRRSVEAKKEGHEINTARFVQPPRPMYSIGG